MLSELLLEIVQVIVALCKQIMLGSAYLWRRFRSKDVNAFMLSTVVLNAAANAESVTPRMTGGLIGTQGKRELRFRIGHLSSTQIAPEGCKITIREKCCQTLKTGEE